MRIGEITRSSMETDIRVAVQLEGDGALEGSSGIGFLDHMLAQIARHGAMNLSITCKGDLEVDGHHSTEDLGICIGKALKEALGDRAGIRRYGFSYVPMDEALARVVMDISGRPYLVFNGSFPSWKVGDWETECVREFFKAVSDQAGLTLHIDVLAGSNTHHMIEAVFKAFGQALKQAVAVEGSAIPSTKGMLD